MGYESRLYAKVHAAEVFKFIDLIQANGWDTVFECIQEPVAMQSDQTKPTEENTYYKYQTDWIKWYDIWEQTINVNSWFNTSTLSAMIQIGEDNEEWYYGNTDELCMYTQKEIVW